MIKFNNMHVLYRAVLASQKLCIKVRPIVTSVRHGGKLLFSDKLLLYTNTGLSVTLSIAGDVMQQNLKSVKDGSGKKWDKTRTSHMAASGLAIGPVAHYWYLYLDRWFPGRNVASLLKKVIIFISKTLLEQVVNGNIAHSLTCILNDKFALYLNCVILSSKLFLFGQRSIFSEKFCLCKDDHKIF